MKKIFNLNLIYYFTFIISFAAFNLFLVNKFFPITEGWFQDAAHYINDGRVMYRDFHMYIPPAFPLLIALLQRFFGDTLIYYRYFGIIERLFLVSIAWIILRKKFDAKIVFCGLSISSVIYVLNLQDLFYGYYQTSIVAALLMLLSAISFYQTANKNNENIKKKIILFSILFAASTAWATLVKHTVGIILGFSIFFVLFLLLVKKNKSSLKYLFFSLCIYFIIIAIFSFIMLGLNAFYPMIQSLFGGDSSKGSYTEILFGFILKILSKASILLAIFIGAYFVINSLANHKKIYSFLFFVLIILTLIGDLILWNNFLSINDFHALSIPYKCLLIALFITQVLEAYTLINKTKYEWVPFFFNGLELIVLYWYLSSHDCSIFGNWSYVRDTRQYLFFAVFFVLIGYSVFLLIKQYRIKNENDYGVELLISVVSWVIMYIHGMSGIIEDHACLLSIAFLFCLILSMNGFFSFLKNAIILNVGGVLILSGYIQRCELPYYWWVNNSCESLIHNTYYFKDPILKGMLGSKDYVESMNKVYDLIVANYQNGDEMYTFPSINYFGLSVDATNKQYGKVDFFDTCPDRVAEMDALSLYKDEPEIIVISACDINCWKVHEELFRNGNKCGQHKIINNIYKMVKNGKYDIISESKLSNSDPIYILVKNDGRKIEYLGLYDENFRADFFEYCSQINGY